MPFPLHSVGGFWRWLWREKNILSAEWPKKKAFDGGSRLYADLPKAEKRVLFKEYLKTFRSARFWLILGLVCTVLGLAAFGMVVYGLIWMFFNGYTRIIWFWTFGVVNGANGFFLTIGYSVYGKFRKWVEYEKNIIKG